eukprot:CAMPEP_0179372348 /NCGR_PEP_ID=MMETSP0797-20121207/86213_1 /TAXON_ID=47934 /ORGANISM="Dinophysis acuminata, Strain DAEP01" /LENGTH=43 /DNA_ID= /DNA_START= /DNA_END= /DNA_ORIENTATION=
MENVMAAITAVVQKVTRHVWPTPASLLAEIMLRSCGRGLLLRA